LQGKKRMPFSRIMEFNKTTYPHIFTSTVCEIDGGRDNWTFSIDDYGLLTAEKNLQEGGVQLRKEIFFIKEFPAPIDIKKAKEAKGVSDVAAKTDEKPKKKKDSSGSGFMVSSDGYVGTNAHVVEGFDKITVEMYNKNGGREVFKADVIYTDPTNDVALLKINDKKFTPFSSLPYGLEYKTDVGEEVSTMGFPLAHIMGTEFKFNDGKINALTGANDDRRYMQVSVALQPGNSGGALFNEKGDIIGIASARLTGSGGKGAIQSVSYGLKIKYLYNLIMELDSFTEKYPNKSSLADKPLKGQIQALKHYICLIRASGEAQ